MKTTKTKKPNMFWLRSNKKMFRIVLATGVLLLALNYGLMAQNASYNANSIPIGGGASSAFGFEALKNNTGSWNSAFGHQALSSNGPGNCNTAVGAGALQHHGEGNLDVGGNTAVGTNALFWNTSGEYNTAVGYWALLNNSTSSSSTAVGHAALLSSTGAGNTAVGVSASRFTTSGGNNAAFGNSALLNNTIGNNNTAVGAIALQYTTSGGNNAAFGYAALASNKTGTLNTGLGYGADVASDNLTNATAIGYGALVNANNTIQLGNGSVTKVYAGVGTAATLITGGLQVKGGTPAVGKVLTSIDANGSATWQDPANVSWSLTGNRGTVDGTHFIGTTDNIPFNIRVNNEKAGRIDANNAFYGYQSGNARTTGGFNTANGYQALYANTAGDGNTAIGDRSLLVNTTGNYNTAIGSLTLSSNTAGKYNTALGYAADVNIDLNNATAIGSGAKATVSNTIQLGDAAVTSVFAGVGNKVTTITGNLQATGGKISTAAGVALNIEVNNEKAGSIDPNQFNTFLGVQSGSANTTGTENTAHGASALGLNTTGSGNTADGVNALSYNKTGNFNTALGHGANTKMGGLTNATAIGAGAIVDASNKIRLGGADVKVIEGTVMYTVSDGRFKTNINEEEVKGLEFIKKLRPVVYNFDTKKFQAFLTQNMPADVRKEYMNKDFSSSTAIRQSGFIAQEVEKAAQEIGYDFNGLHKPDNADDNYSLAYSQFVVPLVKAVQEQQKMIEAKDAEIKAVKEDLQQQIDELKKLIVGNSSLTKEVTTKEVGTANAEDISLYPNPTTGIFTITASNINNGVIEIYDMAGNSMQKTTFNNAKSGYQLNVSGYAKGVYLLNIIANNKKYTKKLVIQ